MNILFSSGFKKFSLVLVALITLGSAAFLVWPGTIERLDIISSNPHPLIRHFAPTWRSLKRITDVPFLFLYAYRAPQLPLYEITLSRGDKTTLFDNLPDYPRVDAMWENYKISVKGEFRAGDYFTEDAKIRPRGIGPNHWNAVKKSWQINLPEDNPLGERTTLRLILPEDKGWIFFPLTAMRARELDLLSPRVSFVRLRINSVDMGTYHLLEGWEESWLEGQRRGLGPFFSNLNLDVTDTDLFRTDSLYLWENRFAAETPAESHDVLTYFLDLVANAPDDIFAQELPRIVDMDMFNRWLIITTLSGNFHQGNIANQNWYLNPATGKLEPVLFDTALKPIGTTFSLANNRLVSRAMRVPQFNATFTEQLAAYLADGSRKERALAFYDKTYAAVRNDIFSDTKKIQPSLSVLRHVPKERETIAHNYDALSRMLAENGMITFTFAEESYPLEREFNTAAYKNTFLRRGASLTEFLRSHRQFVSRGGDTLALPRGTHVVRSTIVVPEGYTLVIDPGARLLFAPGISLFSYSRVESRGTATRPVAIQALDPKKPWGVFAVLEAPGTNTFTHTHIADGRETTFAGRYFSGMLSVRSSNLNFENGSIARSYADDGIHVFNAQGIITHTLFQDTLGDSIDIDFASDNTVITHNTFVNAGTDDDDNGDAIDLSFSKVIIRENVITGCADKGISVGETSTPLIEKNTIIGCVYGIAVKDRSSATITDNILAANSIGIGLYRKKPYFIEGGRAHVRNTIVWDNKTQITADAYSSVDIEQSVIENGYAGTGNSDAQPDLKSLLTADLFDVLQTTLKRYEQTL